MDNRERLSAGFVLLSLVATVIAPMMPVEVAVAVALPAAVAAIWFLRPVAKGLRGIEVIVRMHDELDYIGLVPAYSSTTAKESDRTALMAHLSDIEVANHDIVPATVRRIWFDVLDSRGKKELTPLEVMEEDPRPKLDFRIEGRSRQKFSLKFAAAFDSRVPIADGPERVVLRVDTVGLGITTRRFSERIFLHDESEPAAPPPRTHYSGLWGEAVVEKDAGPPSQDTPEEPPD